AMDLLVHHAADVVALGHPVQRGDNVEQTAHRGSSGGGARCYWGAGPSRRGGTARVYRGIAGLGNVATLADAGFLTIIACDVMSQWGAAMRKIALVFVGWGLLVLPNPYVTGARAADVVYVDPNTGL